MNPVGIVEQPPGYASTPRPLRPVQRLAALLVLAAFLGVGVSTTVASLGAWCLTSDAGNTRALPAPRDLR